jgi:drug/metabolite transporter (DMT)-like permease
MGVALGLLAALLYGSGDYLGGRAAVDVDIRRVRARSQLSACIAVLVAALLVHGTHHGADMAWGAAAGVSAVVGLGLLYRALSVGRAGVVAPLTAVVGAGVPIVWGFLSGERPSGVAMVGIAIALVAAGLIGRERDETTDGPTGAAMGLTAGLVLGLGLVCYAHTSDGSGLWPVAVARVVALALATLSVVLSGSTTDALPRSNARRALVAGMFDVGGTIALVLGLRTELAVLVAAVVALAPGFTVVLAWRLLDERFSRLQSVGIVLALAGLVAISAG